MAFPRIFTQTALIGLVLTITGCASFRNTDPYPKAQASASVVVDHETTPGLSELPTGTYSVPKTRLVVSGHQAGTTASMAFGLVGVLVGHVINSERGKSAVGDASALESYDLASETERLLSEGMTDGAPLKMAKPGDTVNNGARMTVVPYGVLSFIDDTRVRPYIVLRTTLRDDAGKEVWSTRYVAAAADVHPLSGEDGWLRDGAAPLKQAIGATLKRGVDVMLLDIAGRNQRGTKRQVYVGGNYAFLKQPIKLRGTVVEDEPDYIAFAPKIGDVMTFSGVNIFERNSVEISAATEQDPNFQVFEPKKTQTASVAAPAAPDSPVTQEVATAPVGTNATTPAVTK
ncbi:hypothetical protein LXM60_23670 [Pandoraea sputorum]|uniref:hypothetical protein n=1 Tax=Pandoraea sputorum TaxID=93222 RepID=UPI001E379003|nr:hypothetical protein [Pandoraea sputorum]MCE4063205.1 hypothetical protein [Pandoraea sputorum]